MYLNHGDGCTIGITFLQRREPLGGPHKALKPSGMERGNFENRLAALEYEILKYEKATTSRLSDGVKLAVLMNRTRGHLQEHRRLNVVSLSKYHDVKDVATNYIKTKPVSSKDLSNKGPRCYGYWKSLERYMHKAKENEGARAKPLFASHVAVKAT